MTFHHRTSVGNEPHVWRMIGDPERAILFIVVFRSAQDRHAIHRPDRHHDRLAGRHNGIDQVAVQHLECAYLVAGAVQRLRERDIIGRKTELNQGMLANLATAISDGNHSRGI